MSRNTAISVAGLQKRYGDNEVLKGVRRAGPVIDELLERFGLADAAGKLRRMTG